MSDRGKKKSFVPGLIVTLVVLAIAAAAVFFLTEKNNAEQRELAAANSEEEDEQIFAVNTTLAVEGQIRDYLYVNGDIIAEEFVDVYPDTSGKLTDIQVEPGDQIAKGDVVAYIDPSRPGMNFANSPVYSPISGTVTSFPGTIGSTVGPQAPIATIGDLTDLLVRTYISERKISLIALGMPAQLTFEAYPGETFNEPVE